MIVTADGQSRGTLGGGIVERLAIEEALKLLNIGGASLRVFSLNDAEGEATGAVCGGEVSVYFSVWKPDRVAHVFGAGHVALATVPLLSRIGYAVTIYDESANHATAERFPAASRLVIGDVADFASALEPGPRDIAIVLTASHEMDFAVVRALREKQFAYLGVIGSKAKAHYYREKLGAEGWTKGEIARIHTPIGLDIGSRTPEEIAISIAGEVILVRGQSE